MNTKTNKNEQVNRRDFLYVAATGMGVVGTAFAMWPFVSQWSPDASTRAAGVVEVNLEDIKPGQIVTVLWRGKPLFIRNRTKEEIESERTASLADMIDPEPDENRVKSGYEQWLILVGACTHLGCVPKGKEGEFGGWKCACHGSQFDVSGRVRVGPAPSNLVVPEYEFLSDTLVKIG